ncbi:MAG: hypothetical protein JST08_03275 [Actinobacteria bacterium]|nr:hypothetical protein [Actinomycetota bacterium]
MLEDGKNELARMGEAARARVGNLWSLFLDWADRNPEGAARLRLFVVELAETPPTDGLLGLMRAFLFGVAPPNWQGLPAGLVREAEILVSETGLCLVWVPDASIVVQLVEAADREERNSILVLNSDRILDSIEATIEEVAHPELRLLRERIFEATQTARSGFFGASQTLSATVLTGVLEDHYGFSFGLARQAFDAEPPAAAGLWSHRRALVQSAIHLSIVRSETRSPDAGFNRHVTGHGSDLGHLSESHSLEALMLVSAAIRELEAAYRVAECGFALTAQLKQWVASQTHPIGLVPRS